MTATISSAGRFDAARLDRIPAFSKERYTQILIAHDGEIEHFSSQGTALD